MRYRRPAVLQGEDTYTYNGILNITGVQYSSVMFLGILNAMMVQSLISLRRTVFYRGEAGVTPARGRPPSGNQQAHAPHAMMQGPASLLPTNLLPPAERAGGTYVVLPYSASEFLVEAPYLVVQAFFYSIILYWCAQGTGHWLASRRRAGGRAAAGAAATPSSPPSFPLQDGGIPGKRRQVLLVLGGHGEPTRTTRPARSREC